MRPYQITIYYGDKPEVLQELNRPPERRFTTAWVSSNCLGFRVDITIVRPQPEEPEHDFTLIDSKVKSVVEAIPDIVELLEEELR